uniref:NADH-ubiquinone oxidoreductase chain 2 n=1 Tax=Nactus sphaerodactylodes TaxID=476515 RepID=B6RDY3_9SAUR|nr:NADH dehydrogenase subunit 2 [Nactus sp. haerodactylodes]
MTSAIWITLITSITTSTIITMSSNHWLLAWLALELNTLSMLPIIMRSPHPRTTEATTKYFLTQTTAAALILFATANNAWQTGHWSISQTTSQLVIIPIIVALMMKLALAPTHFWYPEVLQGTTLPTALAISTWQKLAPLALLIMMINHLPTNILLLTGLLSTLLGAWMGLNQTQMRKILAFSSIAHMGWLITALTINPPLTTLTLIMYLILTTSLFTSLVSTASKTLLDISTSWPHSPALLMLTLLTLMSLGGLPPLTGFMPKLLILKNLITKNLLLTSTLLALSTLPSLFFYMRITYLATLTIPPYTTNTEYKWRFKTKFTPTTPMILAMMMLPTMPLLYNTT